MPEVEKIRHPSFGMLSINRATCSESIALFGSSIRQRALIQLRITKACLERSLSRDWIYSEGVPLIEIEMSPSQFADAITSLNSEGTPVTITFYDNKPVKKPPFESKRIQFDAEFENKMKEITSTTNQFYKKIEEILSKNSIGKGDKKEILKQLDLLRMQLESNVPFIKEQFSEQMDNTVVEAKNEFTAFMDNKIERMGLTQFKKELMALEDKTIKEEKKDAVHTRQQDKDS